MSPIPFVSRSHGTKVTDLRFSIIAAFATFTLGCGSQPAFTPEPSRVYSMRFVEVGMTLEGETRVISSFSISDSYGQMWRFQSIPTSTCMVSLDRDGRKYVWNEPACTGTIRTQALPARDIARAHIGFFRNMADTILSGGDNTITNVRFIANENTDGRMTLRYAFTTNTGGNGGNGENVYWSVWIDTGGRIVREELQQGMRYIMYPIEYNVIFTDSDFSVPKNVSFIEEDS